MTSRATRPGLRLSSFLLRSEEGLSQEEACILGVLLCDAHVQPHLEGVSPEQVLLFPDGQLTLLRRGTRKHGERPISPSGLDWLSPEGLIEDAPLDLEAAAVFNVAALVMTTLLLELPLAGESDAERYESLRLARFKPLATLCPDVSSGLEATLDRALQVSPQQRLRLLELRSAFAQELRAPQEALRSLLIKVFAQVAQSPVTGEEAAGEGARLVTADALEQEGKVKPAQWLRLEVRHEQAADVQVAEELRSLTTALEPRFVASFVRARLGRCGLLAPDVVRCPGQWAELPATGEPMTRYCVGCDASVQLCLTKDDAEKTFLSGKVLAKPNWV